MISLRLFQIGLSLLAIPAAMAGSLENFERTRADLLETCRDARLTPQARADKLARLTPTAMNASHMVVEDAGLAGKDDPKVREVFTHYEQSFIVHSSAEAGQPLCVYWLTQTGLDSNSLHRSRKAWR